MCTLLKNSYGNKLERAEQVAHQTYSQNQDFRLLPETLRKYMLYCGFTGREKLKSAKITWKDAALKFENDEPWRPMICRQYNFLPEPMRLTYMKNRDFQLVPMEAIDSYLKGIGEMRVKLLYFLPVADSLGKEMNQAELVTILAETILIPLYAVQHYIKWEVLDQLTTRGTITDHGTSASGIFHFNESGEVIKFETNDRFFSGKKGVFEKTKWTVIVGNYIQNDGFRFPSTFKAVWNRAHGDYEYFKGEIERIEFA